jgi:hypothetical protein
MKQPRIHHCFRTKTRNSRIRTSQSVPHQKVKLSSGNLQLLCYLQITTNNKSYNYNIRKEKKILGKAKKQLQG